MVTFAESYLIQKEMANEEIFVVPDANVEE